MAMFGSDWFEDSCSCTPKPTGIYEVLSFVRKSTELSELKEIEDAIQATRDTLIYGKYAKYKNFIQRTLRDDGLYYTLVKTDSTLDDTVYDVATFWIKENLKNGGYSKQLHYGSNEWPDGSFDIKFDDDAVATQFERKFKHSVSREIALDLS